MSEPDTLPPGVHPEAALLPWLANNTLREPERQLVVHHLETCTTCRGELNELTQIRAQLTALYAVEPEASSRTTQSVFQKIADEASSRERVTIPETWLDRLDGWIRLLLRPRMVPSLTVFVLLAQVGLLIWATLPPREPQQVTSRSLSSPTVRFSVVFQGQATEEQIRSLLSAVRGHVVDGPTPSGVYVIEVIASDQEMNRKKLEVLRSRSHVIRSAELEGP